MPIPVWLVDTIKLVVLFGWLRARSNFTQFFIFAVFVLLLAFSFSWYFWIELNELESESVSTTIRNIGFVAGGIIAIGFALWRSSIAEKQTVISDRTSLNEQYIKSAEMLGNEELTVRVAGIHALHTLADTHYEQYGRQVVELLQNYDMYQSPPKESLKKNIMVSKNYKGSPDAFLAHQAWHQLVKKEVIQRDGMFHSIESFCPMSRSSSQ